MAKAKRAPVAARDTVNITRHFATIRDGRWGDRQVHYRRAGKGPILVLFHQSPLSSRDVEPAMRRWAHAFTCIAPDSPGFGLSTPLGVAQADLADFAEAAIEFLDAIGVGKASFYGFHTGAGIAAAVARHFPTRVICAAANGYTVLTESERAEIVANYLPPFVPQWDGSHLTWLWSRMREQTIFFPWYRKSLADRLNYDVPSPAALQAGCVDFMRSGDHYRVAYRAAFTLPNSTLEFVEAPLLVTAARTDVLGAHLARIRRKSDAVTVTPGGLPDETLDLCFAFLKKHRAPAAPALAPTAPLPKRLHDEMVDLRGGQLRVKRNVEASGRTVLVLHDAAGSSDIVAPLAASFIGARPVLAPDLPGHGESDDLLANVKGRIAVADYAKIVLQLLDRLGLEQVDVVGVWGGGLVGLELATLAPKRVNRLFVSGAMYFTRELQAELRKHYTPAIEPDWFGGHLLHAWHLMRDQALFWPWYERTKRGIVWKTPHVAPGMVQARVLEMFKAPERWRAAYQAHFSYPMKSRLAALKTPLAVGSPAWDPNFEHTQSVARDFPAIPFVALGDDWQRWGAQLLPWLSATGA